MFQYFKSVNCEQTEILAHKERERKKYWQFEMLLERKTFSRQEPLNLLLVNLNGPLIRFESTSPTSL